MAAQRWAGLGGRVARKGGASASPDRGGGAVEALGAIEAVEAGMDDVRVRRGADHAFDPARAH
jgi:hypothetical protein